MNSHKALAALAANYGAGAIVQKPFAPSFEEAIEIVDLPKEVVQTMKKDTSEIESKVESDVQTIKSGERLDDILDFEENSLKNKQYIFFNNF